MSEAPTTEAPTTPASAGATLYGADGGAVAEAPGVAETQAAAAELEAEAPAGESTAAAASEPETPAGEASVSAPVYDFKLPEGFSEDAALLSEAQEVLAAAGVAPDKAQPLVDLFGRAVKASSDATIAALSERSEAWLTETNSLPEFQGPTREKSLTAIGRLFDEFGTTEAKQALNVFGVGNNPALAKMMLKIANFVNEGGPTKIGSPGSLAGAGGKPKPTTVGGVLYPDS